MIVLGNKPFHFKQFTVHQDRCAMKIGTDGVLLGAWASVDHFPGSVLDIGAGTGLVALMLAQRTEAPVIDALEIDEDAYEQCVENFERSPWNDRLFCYHAGWDEFVAEMDEQYDLIVSNPPFFSEDNPSDNTSRALARSDFALPLPELIEGVPAFLTETGKFALIVPFRRENEVSDLAREQGLFLQRITRIKGSPQTPYKRSLMEFGKTGNEAVKDELIIELERHRYTEAYTRLTEAFYLNM
ncbi:tRNA1(Val) (adenine(37)-N6)-methyltransferase [Robertkochia aurantiaca]|uniref:tRNA1(Val) (adenine(37)-N6)-methyltransferase n=1 Tax=Robertkochia aurantiaca TaxID=2873700 RepID=UPI001CCBC593|nr:methyltransferase [Robertkochia sp. 3YJGBD-33]